MNINNGGEKYTPPNWESDLPDYIQRKTIRDGKKESDSLVQRIYSELGISMREAVAVVTYTRGLDMDISEYGNNKRILDAGAGFGGLRTVLNKLKINTNVVALDDLESWGKGSPNITVGGRIESLPFMDESFDTIVASYAIPWQIDSDVNPNFMADQLKELIRTLKKGGTIKYRPIRMYRGYTSANPNEDPMKPIFEKAIEQLNRAHAEDPTIKITLVRAYQDDNRSFDEILEITKE